MHRQLSSSTTLTKFRRVQGANCQPLSPQSLTEEDAIAVPSEERRSDGQCLRVTSANQVNEQAAVRAGTTNVSDENQVFLTLEVVNDRFNQRDFTGAAAYFAEGYSNFSFEGGWLIQDALSTERIQQFDSARMAYELTHCPIVGQGLRLHRPGGRLSGRRHRPTG